MLNRKTFLSSIPLVGAWLGLKPKKVEAVSLEAVRDHHLLTIIPSRDHSPSGRYYHVVHENTAYRVPEGSRFPYMKHMNREWWRHGPPWQCETCRA